MTCYEDMTFCSHRDCPIKTCDRYISDRVLRKSEEMQLPLSVADLEYHCKELHEWRLQNEKNHRPTATGQ